jgi:CheY-like chemotaxis protein
MARIVLLVEDYTNLQKVYRIALEAKGYEVYIASDGKEALELANQKQPDLILLDLLLPEADGLSFLREFDTEKHPQTKVIVFSNMASPELMNDAKKLGAVGYIVKSNFTPQKVAGIVEETLGGKPTA